MPESKPNTSAGSKRPINNPNYNAEKDCVENLVIPPQLPQILKQYTKAAMRTQPNNLLKWTHTYMKAMSEGKQPPVKDRGEAEPMERAPSGLTPGFLRVLHRQLQAKNPNGTVSSQDVMEAWEELSFDENTILDVLERAELSGGRSNDWRKVLVVFANTIPSDGDVPQTMRIVCEVITEQPDGAEPYINYQIWWELYVYLAKVLQNILSEKIQKVNDYLQQYTQQNFCLIGPRDFLNNPDCPSLT